LANLHDFPKNSKKENVKLLIFEHISLGPVNFENFWSEKINFVKFKAAS